MLSMGLFAPCVSIIKQCWKFIRKKLTVRLSSSFEDFKHVKEKTFQKIWHTRYTASNLIKLWVSLTHIFKVI